MFSLHDLRFVLCSLDFDVLRAQRIIGFFIFITHNSMRSEYLITWRACDSTLSTNIISAIDKSVSGSHVVLYYSNCSMLINSGSGTSCLVLITKTPIPKKDWQNSTPQTGLFQSDFSSYEAIKVVAKKPLPPSPPKQKKPWGFKGFEPMTSIMAWCSSTHFITLTWVYRKKKKLGDSDEELPSPRVLNHCHISSNHKTDMVQQPTLFGNCTFLVCTEIWASQPQGVCFRYMYEHW